MQQKYGRLAAQSDSQCACSRLQVTICLNKSTQPIECPFRKSSSCSDLLLAPLDEQDSPAPAEKASGKSSSV